MSKHKVTSGERLGEALRELAKPGVESVVVAGETDNQGRVQKVVQKKSKSKP